MSVDFRKSKRLVVTIGGVDVGEYVGYNVTHEEDALHIAVYCDHAQLAALMSTLALWYAPPGPAPEPAAGQCRLWYASADGADGYVWLPFIECEFVRGAS